MPELAEVEVIRRSLWRHMEGAVLSAPYVLRSDVIVTHDNNLSISELDGGVVLSIDRRGKYLIWTLLSAADERLLLIFHFRMTGALFYAEAIPTDESELKHVHVVFPFLRNKQEPAVLIWQDVRRFGRLELMREISFGKIAHTLHRVGPEPFDAAFNAGYLLEQANRHKKLKLAPFLMNQTVVAGLGNIYANETCFASRLRPDSLAGDLSFADSRLLINSIRRILTASIEAGGTSFRDYRDGDGKIGSNQKQLHVYGRQGKACTYCGRKLTSIIISGRRSVLCEHCQQKEGDHHMYFIASGYSSRQEGTETSVRAFEYDQLVGFQTGGRKFPAIPDASYVISDRSQTKLFGILEADESACFMLDLAADTAKVDLVEIGGMGPCHLCTYGEYVYTANYGSGSVSVLYQSSQGLIALGEIQHEGSGPNEERQDGPHTHWVGISPDENYLLAVDLGCDQIFSYKLESLEGQLSPLKEQALTGTSDPAFRIQIKATQTFDCQPGSGPRHLAVSPDARHFYLAAELSAELHALSYNDGRFKLLEVYDVSSGHPDSNTSAIRVSLDGRFVFIAVRGSDRVWSFARDIESGVLQAVEDLHVGGSWPRDFNILGDGRSIVVACERGHKLTSVLFDEKTGQLKLLPQSIAMAAPSCILAL